MRAKHDNRSKQDETHCTRRKRQLIDGCQTLSKNTHTHTSRTRSAVDANRKHTPTPQLEPTVPHTGAAIGGQTNHNTTPNRKNNRQIADTAQMELGVSTSPSTQTHTDVF